MLGHIAACVLCGDQVRDSGPEWMRRFRAVFAWRDGSPAQVSGPGIRVTFGDVMEVEQDPSSDTKSNLARILLNRTRFIDQDPSMPGVVAAWGFPFHASCWTIFREIRPDFQIDVQGLFDILCSFPTQSNIVNFGHDYGGNVEYQTPEVPVPDGDEHRLIRELGRLDDKSDPLEIPGLRSLLHQRLGQAADGSLVARDICRVDPEADPFSRIPEELILAIFEDMPIPGVCRLRRASNPCANIVLPQSFWKHRVTQSDFEYIFEAGQHAASLDGQWESLYHHLRRVKEHPVMKNRERIWKLGHSLWKMLDTKRDLGHFPPTGHEDSLSWVTASRCLTPMDEYFKMGSRALFTSRISVPSAKAHIFVSTVEIHERRYVSGIRVVQCDGASATLGYYNSSCEIRLSDELMEVVGFHIALGERGVRGIAVIPKTGGLSRWAGDHEGVPKRRLVLGPTDATHGVIRYMKAGLDALKLVSLSISDGSDEDTPLEDPLPLRDREIWFPDIPDPHFAVIGMDLPQDRNRRPNTPMRLALFGTDADTSQHARRLVVQTSRDGKLLSLEVTYGDEGNVVRLGLDRTEEARDWILDLDHAAGEEIVGMQMVYDTLGWHMGLKVFTNAGRSLDVLPGSTDEKCESSVVGECHSLERCKVVGFCAIVSRWAGLVDIGLVYDVRPRSCGRSLETTRV